MQKLKKGESCDEQKSEDSIQRQSLLVGESEVSCLPFAAITLQRTYFVVFTMPEFFFVFSPLILFTVFSYIDFNYSLNIRVLVKIAAIL